MTHSALFMEHGLISLKDLTGTLIDIEQFRKQEQGTQQHPNDFISDWLSEKPGDAAMLADATPQAQAGKKSKPTPQPTQRKGLSKAAKAKMARNLAYKKEKAARAAGTAASPKHDPDPPAPVITVSGVPPTPVEDSDEL